MLVVSSKVPLVLLNRLEVLHRCVCSETPERSWRDLLSLSNSKSPGILTTTFTPPPHLIRHCLLALSSLWTTRIMGILVYAFQFFDHDSACVGSPWCYSGSLCRVSEYLSGGLSAFQVSLSLYCAWVMPESIQNDLRIYVFISILAENFGKDEHLPNPRTTLPQLQLYSNFGSFPSIDLPPADVFKRFNMPGRNCHNCPQRNRGGCRWVYQPTRRCATHTYVCPRHNSAYQTYQSCLSCDGERRAAERRSRAGISEPEPNGNRNNQSHNNVSRRRRNNH